MGWLRARAARQAGRRREHTRWVIMSGRMHGRGAPRRPIRGRGISGCIGGEGYIRVYRGRGVYTGVSRGGDEPSTSREWSICGMRGGGARAQRSRQMAAHGHGCRGGARGVQEPTRCGGVAAGAIYSGLKGVCYYIHTWLHAHPHSGAA